MENTVMTDLVNQIVSAVVESAEILTFCLDRYQKKPCVIVGYDDADPPDSEDYPLVVMDVFHTGGFGSVMRNTFEIDLYFGVEQVAKDVNPADNTRIYRGVMEVEELRHLGYMAIFKSRIGKVEIKGDTEQAAFFPRFVSAMTLSIETINKRGRI